MPFSDFFARVEGTPLASTIAQSGLIFPTIETLHVLAIVLVVGSIMIVDLRLLNLASRQREVSGLIREVLPWTWGAFLCAMLTGGLMFISAATRYVENTAFQCKMLMLMLAGINMAAFHLGAYRSVSTWGTGPAVPVTARVAGALSLLIWISVVAFGRWIGFL